MIGLIWAQSANGVIGRDGTLPWHLPEDLKLFRSLTTGATVLMGRRTWESLPPRFRPLPGRRNVVLTRQQGWAAAGAEAFGSVDELLRVHDDFWVMGGAAVYTALLPYAGHIVRTRIDLHVPGDTFAPRLGPEWQVTGADARTSDTGVHYTVEELTSGRA